MGPKLVDVRAVKVVGYEMSGTAAELKNMIPDWTKRFLAAASQIPEQTDGHLMDICVKRTGNIFTHCIAMEVNHIDIIPAGMTSLTIPVGTYAMLEFYGEPHESKYGFRTIAAWAKEHKVRLDPNEFRIDVTAENGKHHLYWRVADKRSEAIEEAV